MKAHIDWTEGSATWRTYYRPGWPVHAFDSDFGATDYGTEIDAVVSFKLGDVGVLAKYANYQADLFGRDTERFWLQASVGF